MRNPRRFRGTVAIREKRTAFIEEELVGTAGHRRRKLEHILREWQFPGGFDFCQSFGRQAEHQIIIEKDGA